MAKVSLTEIQSLPDPLTSDLYEFVIGRVPGGSGDSNVLRIQCQQVTVPSKTIEPVNVDLHSNTVVFAGRMTFSHDLSITFVENRKMDIFNILNGWAEFVRNKQTQLGNFKADYSTTAELYVYDQAGNVVNTFKFYGLWINTIPEYQFDSSAANLITAAATFQYDYWSSSVES